jgi:hypothetical protein
MKHEDFLKHIYIYPTKEGKGRGVLCKLVLYMSSDGYTTFNFLDKDGNVVKIENQAIDFPVKNPFRATKILIDILDKMHRKARRQGRLNS